LKSFSGHIRRNDEVFEDENELGAKEGAKSAFYLIR
jgi:hypothetical protein